jgi:2-haloacid dehalogenase
MSLADVKALCFDVFGTVVDWRGSIAREAAAFFGERGIERDWPAFADAWRARYQPAMEAVRSGVRAWVRLDDLHRENLLDVLAAFGIEGLGDGDIDHLNHAWHRLDPWPDSVEGLRRLKQKYILATLSNGNVALMVDLARRAGLPWDAILGAEVVRHYKPQPEAYLKTADLLGLAPASCLMVAAHENDLEAAAACGLRTAYVHRPTEYDDAPDKPLPAADAFDIVVADFLELAARLGC